MTKKTYQSQTKGQLKQRPILDVKRPVPATATDQKYSKDNNLPKYIKRDLLRDPIHMFGQLDYSKLYSKMQEAIDELLPYIQSDAEIDIKKTQKTCESYVRTVRAGINFASLYQDYHTIGNILNRHNVWSLEITELGNTIGYYDFNILTIYRDNSNGIQEEIEQMTGLMKHLSPTASNHRMVSNGHREAAYLCTHKRYKKTYSQIRSKWE